MHFTPQVLGACLSEATCRASVRSIRQVAPSVSVFHQKKKTRPRPCCPVETSTSFHSTHFFSPVSIVDPNINALSATLPCHPSMHVLCPASNLTAIATCRETCSFPFYISQPRSSLQQHLNHAALAPLIRTLPIDSPWASPKTPSTTGAVERDYQSPWAKPSCSGKFVPCTCGSRRLREGRPCTTSDRSTTSLRFS